MKGPIARGIVRRTFVLGLRLLVRAGILLLVVRHIGAAPVRRVRGRGDAEVRCTFDAASRNHVGSRDTVTIMANIGYDLRGSCPATS